MNYERSRAEITYHSGSGQETDGTVPGGLTRTVYRGTPHRGLVVRRESWEPPALGVKERGVHWWGAGESLRSGPWTATVAQSMTPLPTPARRGGRVRDDFHSGSSGKCLPLAKPNHQPEGQGTQGCRLEGSPPDDPSMAGRGGEWVWGQKGQIHNHQESPPYTSGPLASWYLVLFSGNDPFVACCLNYFIEGNCFH